jgi:excisionase family DNA binding protein
MARHELISTAQAARRLGVSPNTIRNYVADGQLTAIRVGPKLLKFDADEVDSLRQTVEGKSPYW